jgi:hypothetical protein
MNTLLRFVSRVAANHARVAVPQHFCARGLFVRCLSSGSSRTPPVSPPSTAQDLHLKLLLEVGPYSLIACDPLIIYI